MSLYAVWPYVALVAGTLLIVRIDPVFRIIDGSASHARERFSTLDGLRGFLAFGVFGHHAMVTHEYLLTGAWQVPPSTFYALIGEVGIALFFAITGFLFWGKLLKENGAPNWWWLYIGRFFRIAPVYLAAVTMMFIVVSARTHFELREPVHAVGLDVAQWFFLGILGQPDINGYRKTGLLLAGVTWTLRYEWLYYFSLPLLAVFAKRHRHLPFACAGLVLSLLAYTFKPDPPHALYASLFFCGMIAASLVHAGFRTRLDGKLSLAIALLCLWILFANFSTVKGVYQVLLLGIIFYIMSSGNTLLGILTMKCSRRLGEISYSVYLMHGLVLTGVFSVGTIRDYALGSYIHYWLTVVLCALLVILSASLSYLVLERPGIDLGKKVAAWRRPRLAS